MTRDDIRTQFPDATNEQITALLNIHTTDVNKAKGDVGDLNKKIGDLEAKLKTAQEQLADAQKASGELEELNKKVTQLTSDIADRDAKLSTLQQDYDIKDVIRAGKARDVDIVFGLLDRSKINTKNGKLTGIEDQLKAIRENKGFLFEQEEKQPQPPRGGFDGKQDIIGGEGKNTNAAVNNAIRAMTGRA